MRVTQKWMRELASEERAGLGLSHWDKLDTYALCEEHGIEVYEINEVASAPTIAHFSSAKRSSWSAALIPIGNARVIVENESHAPVRRRSNIAHELGHFLLEHPFDPSLIGEDHERRFDQKLEDEAKFLSGELLVPFKAVEQMAFKSWSNAQVSEKFDVSTQFAQMQMKGQRVRATRALAGFTRAPRYR